MGQALLYVPRRLQASLGHDLFCADPLFAGILKPSRDDEMTGDGRSYRRIAHVRWSWSCRDKRTTIVWPRLVESPADAVTVAVHELGHVLHEHIGGRAGWHRMPCLQNVTPYAQTNYEECFAEAFTAWVLYPPRVMDEHPYWPWGYSRENAEWFDRLLQE